MSRSSISVPVLAAALLLAPLAGAQQAEQAQQAPAQPAEQAPAQQAPAQPAEQAPAQQAEQAEEAPKEVVTTTHGDWGIRCSDDVCVMSQIGKDAQGNQVIEMQLRRLKGAKAPDGTAVPAAMQIVTPLGVVLPAGVRIQVDAKKERGAPYETCAKGGCVVRQPIGNDFINELKAGAKAKVTIVGMPQTEVPVTISLSGFTAAYDALQ